jgi:hypothetical protein
MQNRSNLRSLLVNVFHRREGGKRILKPEVDASYQSSGGQYVQWSHDTVVILWIHLSLWSRKLPEVAHGEHVLTEHFSNRA